MMKNNDKTGFRRSVTYQSLLLGGSAMIATTILGFGNMATRDVIALRLEEDLKASISQVISSDLYDNDLLETTLALTDLEGGQVLVYQATRSGVVSGVVFEVAENGYSGVIRSIVAVDPDGVVLGVRVLAHTETPGLGDKIEVAKDDWILGFDGLSLDEPPRSSWLVKKDGGQFDQFSGATITPRAVVKSIRGGLEFFEANKASLMFIAETPNQQEVPPGPEAAGQVESGQTND